jgi:hypothetical protein
MKTNVSQQWMWTLMISCAGWMERCDHRPDLEQSKVSVCPGPSLCENDTQDEDWGLEQQVLGQELGDLRFCGDVLQSPGFVPPLELLIGSGTDGVPSPANSAASQREPSPHTSHGSAEFPSTSDTGHCCSRKRDTRSRGRQSEQVRIRSPTMMFPLHGFTQ